MDKATFQAAVDAYWSAKAAQDAAAGKITQAQTSLNSAQSDHDKAAASVQAAKAHLQDTTSKL
jgi:hypothetical protein